MLVIEDRHAAAAGGHHRADLLHEIPAGEQVLLLLVPRVVTVLADQQHPVHGQLAAPQREGFDDAGVQGHAVLGRHPSTHVLLGELVDVHRGHFDPGWQQPLVDGESLEELAHQHIRVGPRAVLGNDGRDLLALCHDAPQWHASAASRALMYPTE